ncbi:MAG: hypothetical protein IJ346_04030 [Clostridia bacterium]|nr:hypothetical protein [Clostridia bacterium]
MKLRFISLFIATAAILSACCGVFFAQNQEKEVVSPQNNVKNQDFSFSLDTAKKSLRLCSLAGTPENLTTALKNENFEDIEYFQYENSLKSDNKAGLVLCRKDNFLTAIIRGTKDEEWYSNFYIGEGVEHAGFSKAAGMVLKNIGDYVKRHGLKKNQTEVFVTGHSRGAAVGNLTAAKLIDENEFKMISAYNFACPNTTMVKTAENEKYKSIVNILNPQDFICYIPLPQWGFTRYGKTVELPTFGTVEDFDSIYEEMKNSYISDNCVELRDFPHKGKDVENIISYLAFIAPTPEDYYEKEISVGSFRLTLYDYMMKLASVMSGENPLLHGLFMLSGKAIPEVSAITDFVFSGLSEEELKSTKSLDKTPVVANHMHEAYMAWFNVLTEEYFKERLK